MLLELSMRTEVGVPFFQFTGRVELDSSTMFPLASIRLRFRGTLRRFSPSVRKTEIAIELIKTADGLDRLGQRSSINGKELFHILYRLSLSQRITRPNDIAQPLEYYRSSRVLKFL